MHDTHHDFLKWENKSISHEEQNKHLYEEKGE